MKKVYLLVTRYRILKYLDSKIIEICFFFWRITPDIVAHIIGNIKSGHIYNFNIWNTQTTTATLFHFQANGHFFNEITSNISRYYIS